jgi:putative NIF3 family GTP cyclohydrolase 1 type 2
MTIGQIFELALKMGIEADPRGKEGVKKYLARVKKSYDELPEKKKKLFDSESLTNPYSDSRVMFGDPKKEVKRVLAGIDAEEAEVLLADRLTEKGQKIDAVISHHPLGHAFASLDEVMDLQVDVFASWGVPENVAHALFNERRAAVKRKIGPANHGRAVDAARLLNMSLLSIHTIWDNLGWRFMQDYMDKRKYDTLGDLLDYLNEIPEFQESAKGKAGPYIVAGSPNMRAGKVVVGFTGGTNPSKELYMELAKAGVGTLVEMHIPEDALEELKKLHINVIDTGHMASDSIGANIFFDQLEKQGVEVIPCSGLIRVRRTKKS